MRRFFDLLLPGGGLAMSHMPLWREGDPTETDWGTPRERVRPEDGALVRRWTRSRYDTAEKLEHTEDRYEISRDGVVLETELHHRSPATRWHTHDELRALYHDAGFVDVRLTREWSGEPATEEDRVILAVGTRP
jgi:hypothetical protein